MSVEMIRFKRGMIKTPKSLGVQSKWWADVAAAHHVDVRTKLNEIVRVAYVAGQSKMSTHVRTTKRRKGDHRFTLVRERGFLDEYIWLETTAEVSRGRGYEARVKNAGQRAIKAVVAYEWGVAHPLQTAVLAVGGKWSH